MQRRNCLCCLGTHLEELDLRDQFLGNRLVQCTSCKHIQIGILPEPARLKTFYSTQYSLNRDVHLSGGYLRTMARRAEAQLDFCEKWSPVSNRLLLDVGCGYGALVVAAQRRKAIASGLEFDPRAIEHCQRLNLPVRAVGSEDMLSEVVEEVVPNVVVLSHVLEHLLNPSRLLSACSCCIVLIEVPAYDGQVVEQFEDQEGHLNFFNRESLGRLLGRLGFEVLVLGSFGPDVHLFWRADRSLSHRLRRLLSRDYFFRQYDLPNDKGIWLRALARGRLCEF